MKATPAVVLVGLGGVAAAVLLVGAAASPPGRAAVATVTDRVGRFFTLADLSVSAAAARLAIDNTPPPAARYALAVLVTYLLDPLRSAVGRQVVVSSGYRCPAVNRAVEGSETSQHLTGEAVDIQVPGVTAEQLARLVVRLGLPFDQLIWYAPERGGHLHLSLTVRRANRGESMHAPAGGGFVTWRA